MPNNLDEVLDEMNSLLREALTAASVSGGDRQKILTAFQRTVRDNYRRLRTDLFEKRP